MKKIIAAIIVTASCSPASAVEFDQTAAWGVAKIIGSAKACGYVVDQSGMDKHLADAGLNSSAALGFITLKIELDKNTGVTPSEAECTVTKSTAKSLGITH